jgi:hypothetical protein
MPCATRKIVFVQMLMLFTCMSSEQWSEHTSDIMLSAPHVQERVWAAHASQPTGGGGGK